MFLVFPRILNVMESFGFLFKCTSCFKFLVVMVNYDVF